MTSITLEYDYCDIRAQKQFLPKRKKTGLEEALDDVENGRLTTIHLPKNPS